MSIDLRFRNARRTLGTTCLVAMMALSWALAGHGSQRHPVSRTVFVTDSRCGADVHEEAGEERAARTAVLRCLARGAHLVLHDQVRDRLFEIEYDKPELVIQLTNDFAGRKATVRGFWDDQERRVVVLEVHEAQEYEVVREAPRRR